jgi:hypothetical protein
MQRKFHVLVHILLPHVALALIVSTRPVLQAIFAETDALSFISLFNA